MILNGAFVAAGDEDEMLDTGGACLIDDVLDHGSINNRQHLFGDGFGRGQKAGAKTCDGKDGFTNARHGELLLETRRTDTPERLVSFSAI